MEDRKKTFRVERVNTLIKKTLGPILTDFLSDAGALITISKVEVSKDLRWAKVWISIFGGNDEKIFDQINRNIYEIQGELNRKFSMKMVPRLQFALDSSPRYVQKIDEVIKKMHEE